MLHNVRHSLNRSRVLACCRFAGLVPQRLGAEVEHGFGEGVAGARCSPGHGAPVRQATQSSRRPCGDGGASAVARHAADDAVVAAAVVSGALRRQQ
jgi:hypothetical protein